MIINSLSLQNRFNYYCNGTNDNVNLLTFITQIQNSGYSRFIINVIGRFGVNSSKTTVDSVAWSSYYNNSSRNKITLDFTQTDEIAANGSFLYVNNVTVRGAKIRYTSGTGIIGFRGIDSSFINCEVRGNFSSGNCYGFSGQRCDFIGCVAELYNASGVIYGIYGTYAMLDDCYVVVNSNTASAYGLDLTAESRINNSYIEGITNSSSTTVSGSGAIGGGYYANSILIGKGALKGHGYYCRAGYLLSATGCIFRGYTKNTSTGLGAGIAGANDASCTYILSGINCNQVAAAGYSQTDPIFLTNGYGICTGTFFAANTVPSTFTLTAAYNRNRV